MSMTDASANASKRNLPEWPPRCSPSPVDLNFVVRQAGAAFSYPNHNETLPRDYTLGDALARVIQEARTFVQQVTALFDESEYGNFVTRAETMVPANTWHRLQSYATLAQSNLPDPMHLKPGGGGIMFLSGRPLPEAGPDQELADLLDRIYRIWWPFRPHAVIQGSGDPITVPGAVLTAVERIANALEDTCKRARRLPDDGKAETDPKPASVLPISGTVACKRYAVSKSALCRAVKQRTLTDHRKPGGPANASLLLDESEVAARWPQAITPNQSALISHQARSIRVKPQPGVCHRRFLNDTCLRSRLFAAVMGSLDLRLP
ncbi:MAG: hypothetical protein L0219_05510 [Phycisphaerales bacterium]|nr:hypothetical protein [Phycisphaerales bacterium]